MGQKWSGLYVSKMKALNISRKGFASKLKKNLEKIQVKQSKNAPSKINLN